MRRYYSRDKAKALAKYVNGRILDIQRDYTRRDGGTPESRARLARLRRDLDGSAPSWMMIGDELFTGWPNALPDLDDANEEVLAAKSALELYALHQQSRRDRAAQEPMSDMDKRMTFGRACRMIEPDSSRANGVKRRLQSIEATPDFDGMVRGIRSLIMLMRQSGRMIPLDYRSLTQDLYQLQFPESRGKVFERWSFDYSAKLQSAKEGDAE
ncbi:type I-E CRISPR-associated protein Cse2/CasB [Bifidobacterium callitrichos]|uniref:Type I-E CRISPR-associated protein Cse2/CasB n=1 Tax=Bifidobacterium callitrichos TaxID=762209 RepID=A0A2T3GCG2_9BIFI|nr:type I-E CRISPR-associated protein Cse2/CasB [Bifidobacterium callitrichos]PST47174.1 type I-E CRISPR-associated protein Cse2/CasB [Bifidobacterium callitrichos]